MPPGLSLSRTVRNSLRTADLSKNGGKGQEPLKQHDDYLTRGPDVVHKSHEPSIQTHGLWDQQGQVRGGRTGLIRGFSLVGPPVASASLRDTSIRQPRPSTAKSTWVSPSRSRAIPCWRRREPNPLRDGCVDDRHRSYPLSASSDPAQVRAPFCSQTASVERRVKLLDGKIGLLACLSLVAIRAPHGRAWVHPESLRSGRS
jgi:hypothetical protein